MFTTITILHKLDRNEVILIAFLDLSAAFDGVDHHILFDRFQVSQFTEEDSLEWIESYLSQRT